MTRNERELKAVEQEMVRVSNEIQDIWKKADVEDRGASDEERLEVEKLVKSIETVLKPRKEELEDAIRVEQDVKRVSHELGKAEPAAERVGVVSEPMDRVARYAEKSLGRMFVESDGYKSAKEAFEQNGRLPSNFSTGALSFETKAGTLFEGAQGAGLFPVPQVIPGVVQTMFQPLRVADLLLTGQTNTNSLRYIVEGTATNSAAAVAEGGTKPASDLALSTVDEPVKKIATILTVSDEMLEDAAQVESYINGRLTLFVQQAEEASLVSGGGTNDLYGLLDTSRGINKKAAGTVDNNAVALFKAMNGQRGSAFIEPDFIVMNPANWQTTRLLTDQAGQFFGGGPFQGQYGAGPMVGDSGQISGNQDYLWGKPVVITTAVGAGTAVVGTRSAAQIWRRGGVTVEATNSHGDYFVQNLVALRAESRLALAVYRPAAFTMVTGLA